MEAVLVSVSTGVMKPLLAKLSKLLEQEYGRVKCVRHQMAFLKDELGSMKAALETLTDVEQLDAFKEEWRNMVRELAYDVEDCIDVGVDHEHGEEEEEEEEEPTARGFIKGFFRRFKKLKARRELAGQIQQLKSRATEASERHKRYNFVEPAPSSSTCAIDPRLPALYKDVDKLVGIHVPREHIVEWFSREEDHDENLKVLAVVGSGGLGKTTLANQVYRQLKPQFQCSAFVSVSRNPHIKMVFRQILAEVGVTDYSSDDERQLIDRIRDYLRHKRYFIVVDDVWDADAWKAIRLALFNNRCGSKIITTTRNVAVASFCSSDGGYVYRMGTLSFFDSRRLLFKRAFGSEEVCYPHLEEVSRQILEKCGGLPLAIVTISSLLAGQHAEDEWGRVLTAIGSSLAKDPDAVNMTKILSLSYFDLPHHLRACLLYLSVFPEDSRINKQRLISRWIAEGFAHQEQGRSTYEICESYFNDLINRSLIQPVDVMYGQAEACQVHDIVHDFITCKAAEENFVTSINDAEHGHISNHRVRRLSVSNHSEDAILSTSLMLSHVRSLTIFGGFMPKSLLAFPTLRVLDLGECWRLEDHHIANIEKLVLLKYLRLGMYLHLGQSRITELPRKIGQLRYLETLDIQDTRIIELPSTITNLQRLVRLYVHHRTRFPDGIIGQMQNLEELHEFGVSSYKQGKSLREFGQLNKLRMLKVAWSINVEGSAQRRSQVEDLRSYVGTLIASCNLRHLYILSAHGTAPTPYHTLSLESWCPTTPCCSLQKLHLTYGYIDKVPDWMSSLGNLRELNINIFSMRPEDVATIGAIPTLLFLQLRTFYGTNESIVISGFTSLKYFYLENKVCGTWLEFEAGSMPKLEHLKLEFAVHKMGSLNGPSDFGIQHLSALTKVEVIIHGDSDGSYRQAIDKAASLIETAVGALPSRPTLALLHECDPFLHILESIAGLDYTDEEEEEEQEEEEEEEEGIVVLF